MATVAARGTGTPATTGTTWASATNAVDGAAGTNPATYATLTSTTSGAVATIEITGYGFSSSIGAGDTLTDISVSLRHFENNTGRFASVAVTVWDGATQIGGSNNCTLATSARNDAFTYTPTVAQLRSSTFKTRVTITGAASTQSRIESIDYVDVTATYTPLPPAVTQAAYRFYADGTESGSTALGTQSTSYAADLTGGDLNLGLRVRLQETNAVVVPSTDDWQLQYDKNASGTWHSIPEVTLADSYAETNVDNLLVLSTGDWRIGQSFLGNGQPLSRASFWMRNAGAPTGNMTADLYAHTGTFGTNSQPGVGSSPLTTSTAIAASTLTTTEAWVDFTFDGSFTPANGTAYVIVVSYSNGDASNHVRVGYDNSSPTHAGNKCTQSNTGTWSPSAVQDTAFRVYTAATPAVAPYASANLTDGGATTNRLGSGTGSFVAGKVSEDGLVDDLGWTASNYTELLYSITLKQANLADTDSVTFRVLKNAATTGMTYTSTPTTTITLTGGAVTLAVANAAHAHTAENVPLIVDLVPANTAHAVTSDNVAVSIPFDLVVADATHAHTADNVVVSIPTVLVVQDAAHGHTAADVVLGVVLAVDAASHAHVADNVVLVVDLIVAPASHAVTSDNVALVVDLAVQDAAHGHSVENVALVPNLIAADALHAHTADNVTLTALAIDLTVANTAHAHIADSLVVYAVPDLAVASSAHAVSSGNVTLVVELIVAAASHAHSSDSVALVVDLVVANAAHAHVADNVAISIPGAIGIQNAAHAHTADNVTLGIPAVSVTVDNAAHAVTSDTVTLTFDLVVADAAHAHTATTVALVIDLVIADASHGHTAGNVTLSVGLVVDDASHTHTAENATLGVLVPLAIDSAFHTHTAANVTVLVGITLVVADTLHAHHADTVALERAITIVVLNAATAAYYGATPASAFYVGATQVWP